MAVDASLGRLAAHSIRYLGARSAGEGAGQYSVSFDVEGQVLDVYAIEGDPASAALTIASALADELCELFWGEAIPPCPGHAHPMTPQMAPLMTPQVSGAGAVVWQCPVDGRPVDQIWPV